MRETYDVIVLGLGGMGSAACYHLAQRGLRVLGLEQYSAGHDRGSSHGETRIIRRAYFEHPNYVPLLLRAYQLWADLEAVSQRRLYRRTQLLLSGPPEGETIHGSLQAARLHGLEVHRLHADDARQMFPGIAVPLTHAVVLEPEAGFLYVEDCVRTHWEQAVSAGAVLRAECCVREWTAVGRTVRVRTDQDDLEAAALVLTAGAWTSQLLRQLKLPLTVVRKFVGWFSTEAGAYHVDDGYPAYYFELPQGAFYGFPSLDAQTIKVAEHTGGETIHDPASVDRGCAPDDLARLMPFLEECLPRARPECRRHSVCLYTLTPDRHFLIDTHPEHPQVCFAAGFSGHGFKFCPVVGEVLADLVQSGLTTAPIEFLRLYRLAQWSADTEKVA